MDKNIVDVVAEMFDIKTTIDYEFKEIYGFTFTFKRQVTSINKGISSAEIIPAAIIYEENGEYVLAPLADEVDTEKITEAYVEEFLK